MAYICGVSLVGWLVGFLLELSHHTPGEPSHREQSTVLGQQLNISGHGSKTTLDIGLLSPHHTNSVCLVNQVKAL